MLTDSSSSDDTDMEEAVSNKDDNQSKSRKSKGTAAKNRRNRKRRTPVQDARRCAVSRPSALKINDSDSYTIIEPTAKLSEKDGTFTINGI